MPRWKHRLFVALERLGKRFANLLFTQSAEDARTAEDEGLAPPGRILAIGNGVDPRRFDPTQINDAGLLRRDLGIPEDAFVIGIIARLVEGKWVCEFLRTACLAAVGNSDFVFLMLGERLASDHARHVSADITEASNVLSRRLVMTGAHSDVPELLAAMDVFCLPSWREKMPRTIIEAMIMSKPVIATNIRRVARGGRSRCDWIYHSFARFAEACRCFS